MKVFTSLLIIFLCAAAGAAEDPIHSDSEFDKAVTQAN
jgi:hypothetical protein